MIDTPSPRVSTKLKFGIFLLPLVFVWFVFKPESAFPIKTKVISFSWLCFLYAVSYSVPNDNPTGEIGVMCGVLTLAFVPFLISLAVIKYRNKS
ncbi:MULTISPECIES: hypothetical protein [Vibrio]|uniref:Uncharacterized protein n=1 Tax=Vibrio algicola TaxID=2662262 RepID=A0A5Q0THI0_9VIBR|nr:MULTISPECIES: hypothetical protein [Vibrio]MBD1577191.1 hypothetical protein [Vibrio sp. S11_S32]